MPSASKALGSGLHASGEGCVLGGGHGELGVLLDTPEPKGQGHFLQVSAKVSALPRAGYHGKALPKSID